MITMYLAQVRSALLQQFQYRAANYFYMIGMIAEPVVYLVVWSTIARAHGGSIDGLTPGGFAAYYIVWTLVRNMNIVLTPVRVGGAHQGRDLLRSADEAGAPDPRGPCTVHGLEGCRAAAVASDRGGPDPAVPPDAEPHRAAVRGLLLRHLGRILHPGDHAVVARSHHVLDHTRQRDLRGVLPQRVVAVGPGLPAAF